MTEVDVPAKLISHSSLGATFRMAQHGITACRLHIHVCKVYVSSKTECDICVNAVEG